MPPFAGRGGTTVVVTTHGNRGDYATKCVDSVMEHLGEEGRVVLFNNESKDPRTMALVDRYGSDLEYVFVPDQKKGGGLTGTWNRGCEMALRRWSSDVVVLLNHDTVVDETFVRLIEAAKDAQRVYDETGDVGRLGAFGPVSDRPEATERASLASPQHVSRFCSQRYYSVVRVPLLRHGPKVTQGINGFCLAFPRSALERNALPDGNFFDPDLPFGGNENEWFDRWRQLVLSADPSSTPCAFVARNCLVRHAKLHDWVHVK